MSKREKIIVFLMVLSLVYGFYVFYIEAPGKKRVVGKTSKLESLNKFITHIANLTKESLSEIDSYIIEKAPKQWDKDPLLSSDSNFQFRAESTQADLSALKVNIKYTGYLKMGPKNIAILNGLEYEEGEELENSGFIIRKIFSDRVIIEIKGKQKEITIPIEDL